MKKATSTGLEGVVVAETAISHVDGERGQLVIAGADAEQLAATADYATAAARVLTAGLGRTEPGGPSFGGGEAIDGAQLAAELGRVRAATWELLPRLGNALEAIDGMEALRAGLAHLWSSTDDRADAFTAIGAAPVIVAAWSRKKRGLAPIPPDPKRDHATDYLHMSTGASTPATAKALDAYLVTVIDHGLNASTFTARVVASTASDMISAVVAAVGALKGPLHGGAPGPVLDMLDAIGTPGNAEAWLLGELAAGRRIMGMGHRIYRVRDPRAAVLETAVKPLSSPRLELAHAVEAAAAKILAEKKPDRPLAANVEFYTAVLLDAVGLPRDQFSSTFGVGRVAGWCAHVLEQRATGKLIRPASNYIGPMPA